MIVGLPLTPSSQSLIHQAFIEHLLCRQDKKMTHTLSLQSSNLQLNEADKLAHSIIIQDRLFFGKGRGRNREGKKKKEKMKA